MSLDIGKKGELAAEKYLVENGYEILMRNFRYKKSEIDILCLNKDFLVVVEVKLRKENYVVRPMSTVDKKKQKLLISGTNAFIEKHAINHEVRFDVIEIFDSGSRLHINHIADAFSPLLES